MNKTARKLYVRKLYVVTDYSRLARVTVRKETEKSYLIEREVENFIDRTWVSGGRLPKEDYHRCYYNTLEAALQGMLDGLAVRRESATEHLRTHLAALKKIEDTVLELQAALQRYTDDV